jgi:hypothetical protein
MVGMRQVWVVESGDYEQRGIDVVAKSLDAAVEAVKAMYPPPYEVKWGEVSESGWGQFSLRGDFDAVPGKSTKHETVFTFTAFDVKD